MQSGTDHNRRRHTGSTRRGVAAVEFAFIVPMTMLFAIAATDYGRVIFVYTAVSNAARRGAEYGSMHGYTSYTRSSWETNIKSAVTGELQNLGNYDSTSVQTDIATTIDSAGLFRVAVTVSYPFQTAVTWVGIPSQVVVNHRVEMRHIQ